MKQRFKRSSGIVLPVFSLPSNSGIGTMGKAAYDFVDFLVEAKQKYWQILPMGHTGFGESPYQTYSSVAGNPYFIDLDILVSEGMLLKEDLPEAKQVERVDYEELHKTRLPILRKAYKNAYKTLSTEITAFALENKEWVRDYAMFMAIKDRFNQKPIWEWEDWTIRGREKLAMLLYESWLEEDINFYIFVQYLFFSQWKALKTYANTRGIQIIGDLPIYPSADSCDVWANPHLFEVDENLRPKGIAGVPPDLYSETGQLWGTPVYNWKRHEKKGYAWWIQRIKNTLKMVDVIRIDHFRGLCDYWVVPQGETTAIKGEWVPGPKMKLFDAIRAKLGDVPIIAEDLGIITDEVREFLEETGYPGMRVMIFGFNANQDDMHQPHNWPVNCVGYTSTHDSETFEQKVEECSSEDREFILRYIRADFEETLGINAICTAFASPASLVMVPMQDVLSLGKEGRINVPSTIGGNWSWEMEEGMLTEALARKLATITKTYKR